MADGDTVKMKLTFWRGTQRPGTVVEVPADEVHRWKGFATQVEDPAPDGSTPDGRPADTAKIDDWRAYAIRHGMDKPTADKATKADLVDFADKARAGAKA
ncbi:hypothetical protein [Streptomyces sp. SID8352]|uniref:hypothetical protein n=1 Tax=Streptomyces sp. SID8352 TaxID=2690338 RepID=UPI00139C456D|nr:hypothetical protein [Streptomyces sp. SID8352]MYU24632.1 hypothetical protein [Streptomyces sp. SID8352]